MRLLPVRFFDRPADVVARALLGAVVVSDAGGVRTAGRIVETEAYLAHTDPASHGFGNRRTARNAAMFGAPGDWYVYRIYGMHWCANLVTEPAGIASAVLLRALEPLEGLDAMRARRGRGRPIPDRALCSGPGKLCQALGITRTLDGQPMRAAPVRVLRGRALPDAAVRVTGRIGITRAADWPLRFVVADSPWLSRR
ncbi:MAG TPA: DNA-3-methyladenine glycosylase [Gemmatimonadales bacterium]|nr:DNA-3-methyladenine glycosylase [Gemmatimonadales bacterium]